MIKVTNLSFGFPQKDLFKNIYFEIKDNDHVVLIGSNGTGKSTLISMIMDREKHLFDGKIEMPANIRIGYVSQYTSREGNESVYDFLAAPFTELMAKSDAAANDMATAEDMDVAFELFQKYQDEIDAMDAYNYDVNIRKQLATAGLDKLVEHTLDTISGGEYKLLSIIRSMLLKPQLLIMDEPDVFLDFENLVGLSKLINHYEGTMLVVSHNRLLLGQCFDKILHLEDCELQEFPGTFAEYNKSMLETKTMMAEQAKKDEDWIEVQKKVLERYRRTATALTVPKLGAQVHARASYLERLITRKAKNPFLEARVFNLHFPVMTECESNEECKEIEESNRDKVILSIKDYSLIYDKTLLADVNFEIKAGEKVALVGANGTGKSSLLGDLVKQLKNSDYVDKYVYFSQIYEDAERVSGGEKNISQLYAISEKATEILLLDEPSSHLDTYAQIALEDAIREYKGTVLMVSHDFYTVVNCVDRILLIDHGTITEMSTRAFRKRIYKRYFRSDIFEQEKAQKDLEVKINSLLKKGKIKEAKIILGLPEEEAVKRTH